MRLEEEKTFSPHDLIILAKLSLRRYWAVAIAPALAVFWLSIIFAIFIPNYYQADALIIVQPQRMSSEVIKQELTQETRDRMESLLQTVLSRPRLRKIVRRFQLYPELISGPDLDQATARLRKAIEILQPQSNTGAMGLMSFRLSYSYRDPDTVYQVAKSLTDLFVEESVLDARQQIKGQLDFIDSGLTQARKELEETENAVQEFVRANFGQLPEDLKAAIARMEAAQNQLATNTEMINANTQRREHLRKELRDLQVASGLTSQAPGEDIAGSPSDNLAQLEQALLILTSKYSEKHPDVIRTRQRMASLKEQIKSGKPIATTGTNLSPLRLQQQTIERQINEFDVSINALQSENQRLRTSVEELEKGIKNMPMKEQELIKIKRDYDNKRQNYDQLLKGKSELELKADLIKTQQDTQYKVVESPEKPFAPAGPSRILIVGIGIVLSSMVFCATIFARLLLGSSYKRKEELESDLSLNVIGVIPPLKTRFSRNQHRKSAAVSVAISALILFFGGLSILFYLEDGVGRIASFVGNIKSNVMESQSDN